MAFAVCGGLVGAIGGFVWGVPKGLSDPNMSSLIIVGPFIGGAAGGAAGLAADVVTLCRAPTGAYGTRAYLACSVTALGVLTLVNYARR